MNVRLRKWRSGRRKKTRLVDVSKKRMSMSDWKNCDKRRGLVGVNKQRMKNVGWDNRSRKRSVD
jgi:hypothetical protein